MVSLPTDLVWRITKRSNSFAVYRKENGGAHFDRHPLSLNNVHNATFSPLANYNNFVAVQPAKGGVTIITRSKNFRNKPKKSTVTVTVKKQFRPTAACIKKIAKKANRKMKTAALRRYSRIFWTEKGRFPGEPHRGLNSKKKVTKRAAAPAPAQAAAPAQATAAQ
eukprot:GEZU01034038.1.p2 GENE.GEZU01034038.1~~GEZU01034038.1.p2  ORF type:complete len:188 (-),score=58.17 GEZU01034038.1:64-558(-)